MDAIGEMNLVDFKPMADPASRSGICLCRGMYNADWTAPAFGMLMCWPLAGCMNCFHDNAAWLQNAYRHINCLLTRKWQHGL